METRLKDVKKRSMGIFVALALVTWCLQALSQNDPGSALLLEQSGKTIEAESAWSAISKAHPTNSEPYAHLGLLEARQEHYEAAIHYYRRALTLNPTMPGLRLNMGLALFKDGDYKQALQIFEPLIKAEPQDQRLTILVGMSHFGLGDYATAAPFLKKAADHDPQNLTLLLKLAHSCLLSRQYPCVLDAYHQIIALNAESAEADMLVGETLDEMKDPIGAVREFRAAILANPKEPNVHFGLGYLLWTQGHFVEAAQQFQAEIDNDSRHIQATLYLADSEIQMNRMDDATPLLEQLVKINPKNPMEHRDLGIVYAAQGRNEGAVTELQTAIRLAPADVNAHWRLARLYNSIGKKSEAKVEFNTARSLNKTEDERLLKVMSTIPAKDKTSPTKSATPTNK